MEFYIVDAFTDQIFGGNPAGVVILPKGEEFPSEMLMGKLAAELRYSETAFVKNESPGIFKIRYFTPTEEVELCGHATVASFYALLDSGYVKDGRNYKADTKAGCLNISLEKGLIMMDMAPPQSLGSIESKIALIELYEVMGLSGRAGGVALEGEWVLYPEIISTGLPDIILPVESREILGRIKPDFPALTQLSNKYGVTGVHVFAPGEGLIGSECCGESCDYAQITAYCRNFAPSFGIDEEAATGTANGALIFYLYKNALIDLGSECRFLQGEAMNRPSIITGTVSSDEQGQIIRVGGSGAILAKGEVWI